MMTSFPAVVCCFVPHFSAMMGNALSPMLLPSYHTTENFLLEVLCAQADIYAFTCQ